MEYIIEVKSPDSNIVSIFQEGFLKTHTKGIMFTNQKS